MPHQPPADSAVAERYPDAARFQRSFQLGFRVGAVVAALALALGVVSLAASPFDAESVWNFSE